MGKIVNRTRAIKDEREITGIALQALMLDQMPCRLEYSRAAYLLAAGLPFLPIWLGIASKSKVNWN